MLQTPTSLPGVLSVGLVLGLQHALDPDHVVVVTTLATRQRRALDACRLGFAWSLGHSASILAVVGIIIAFNLHLPESWEPAADTLVGVLLVALGVTVIVNYRRGRYHVHFHSHDDGPGHVHLHSHAHTGGHLHGHARGDARRSFGFGLLHGLAGSATILLMMVGATPERLAQFGYLAAFIAGTVLSMVLVSLAVASAVRVVSLGSLAWMRLCYLGSAAASIAVGVHLAVESAGKLA